MTATATRAKYTIESKLMKTYESGTSVSADKQIATASDVKGEVMFFSIGSDSAIYYFSKANGTETGWDTINLCEGFPDRYQAKFIATAQDEQGKPILAAVFYNTYTKDHEVFFTKDFNAAVQEKRWIFRGKQTGKTITNLTTGYGKQGQVIIVITIQENDRSTNFLVNPKLDDPSWLWREVPSPVNSTKVLQTAIGHHHRLESVDGIEALLYALHQTSDNETQLVITSLPDFHYYNHTILLDINPTAFGLIANAQGSMDLYVGDATLYYLDSKLQMSNNADEIKTNKTAIGGKLPYAIKNIQPGILMNGLSEVWYTTEDGRLLHAAAQSEGGWTVPLPFQAQVEQISAWRNSSSNLNDLFTVNTNNQLKQFSQDLVTTRWKAHDIMTPSLKSTTPCNAYLTQIQLTDEKGYPLTNQTITVKASELTQVTINSKTYYVDSDQDYVEVKTDTLGNVTIINKIDGLAAPTLRIESPALAQPIDIDPVHQIKERLSTMSTDDFANAQMQTEEEGTTEPLFKGKSKEDLTGAHQAIQQLVQLGDQLPKQNVLMATPLPSGAGFKLTSTTSPLANKLNVAPLGENYQWGLDLSGEHPIFHETPHNLVQHNLMTAGPLVGNPIDDVIHFFGDVWHAVKNGLIEVVNFVVHKVEEGIMLVINGAKEVFRVIVQFAEQVWDVIQYVVQKLGATFKEIVRWLGYIFKWKDILRSHDVIRSVINLTFDHAVDNLESAKDFVKQFTNEFKDSVLGKNLPQKLGTASNDKIYKGTDLSSHNNPFSSPEGSWVFYHVNNGSMLEHGHVEMTGTTALNIPFTKELETVKQAFLDLGKELSHDIETMTTAEFLNKLLLIMEEAVIDAIELLALGMIEAAKFIVSKIKDVMNTRWNIPLITPLYEDIIAPGSKLTLLDLISLLVAIPGTIVYKIATNEAPFSEAQAKAIASCSSYEDMKQLFSEEGSSPVLKRTGSCDHLLSAKILQSQPDDAPPLIARGFSYFFGFVGSISSMIYGVTNGMLVAADTVKMKRIVAGAAIKFVTGLVTNISSLVTMSISIAYVKDQDKARLGYEMFFTLYQGVFNFKDGLALYNEIDTLKTLDPDDIYNIGGIMRDVVATIIDLGETCAGALNAGFSTALFIADMIEAASLNTGLKFPQNLVTSITQILSLPGDLLEEPRAKAVLAAVQVGLGVVPGLINATRTGIDLANNEIHANI
jgi:hypothetical protein